jgi:hypothetical protein
MKVTFSPKTLNIIVLIFGVIILAAVWYYSCANREGFDGSVPRATQTSAIPADTPGATSSNPTIAKPQTKDVQAALDEADAFFILAATFDAKGSKLPIKTKHDIAVYRRFNQDIQADLKKALAEPESSDLTLKQVADLRTKLAGLSKTIRGYTRRAQAAPSPDVAAAPLILPPEKQMRVQSAIKGFVDVLPGLDVAALKDVDGDTQFKVGYYAVMSSEYLEEFKTASTMTDEEAAYLEKTYAELTEVVKRTAASRGAGGTATATEKPVSYETTVMAGAPGVITLKELDQLVSRIDEEHLRLANLRSTSATLQARQTQLEKLAADVRELAGAVRRKEMKLEDVPISPASADAFMKRMRQDGAGAQNAALPPLIEPRAEIANGLLTSAATPTPVPGMDVKALYGLLDNTKYLKWNLEVKLEYDPKVGARDALVKRLEAIEQRLSALAVSETPISKEMYDVFIKELQVINAMVAPEGASPADRVPQDVPTRPATTYTRSSGAAAEYPSTGQIYDAAAVRDGASGNAVLNPSKTVSPDVFIRPGFVMNDDTIQRRASASAFDDSIVGGADYKKRSQDLCRQIQGANLGQPVQFGCISNPDAVGPEYSWKGNFTMVCNRLGDTWGGWYPEMFGCPKYDPTQKFNATMM